MKVCRDQQVDSQPVGRAGNNLHQPRPIHRAFERHTVLVHLSVVVVQVNGDQALLNLFQSLKALASPQVAVS